MKQINDYDIIYIGSSPLSILDAACQKSQNKNVLIIENKSFIGGSWACVDIFGYKEVENAIHYFLPSYKGIKFMRDVLKWNIVNSNNKFRVLNKKIFYKQIFKYDNPIGKIISKFTNREINKIFSISFLQNLFNSSYYLEKGSKEIIKFCKKIIKDDNIDILYQYNIENININSNSSNVNILIKDLKPKGKNSKISINTKKINLTHGLKIKKIEGDKGSIKFKPLIEPRPHIHLLVKDNQKLFNELIFDNNKYIKYIHEVSNYIDSQSDLNGEKIYILALKPEIINNKDNILNILKEMENYNVLSNKYEYIDHQWTDVFLPELTDEDLIKVKQKYQNQVEIMLTENFSKAIELYQSRWYERFSK